MHVDFNWVTTDKLVNMSPLSPQIPSILVRLKPLSDIKYAALTAFCSFSYIQAHFQKDLQSLCDIWHLMCEKKRDLVLL